MQPSGYDFRESTVFSFERQSNATEPVPELKASQKPWNNRPPYPPINPNPNPDFSLQRSVTALPSPGSRYGPAFSRPSIVPPEQLPSPTFMSPVGRPFIPIEQRSDIFFERPRSHTTVTRSFTQRPSAPAPPIPPHPFLNHPNPPPPVQNQLLRTRTAPPIPPKPMFSSAPSLPPKIPLHPPAIPASTRLDVQHPIIHAPSPQSFVKSPSLDSIPPSYVPISSLPTSQVSSAPVISTQAPPADIPPTKPTHTVDQEPSLPQRSLNPPTSETSEEDELKKVLALSASESATRERLKTQEEADLANALLKSLELTESELFYASDNTSDPFSDSHAVKAGPSTDITFSTSPSSPLPTPQPQYTPAENSWPPTSPIDQRQISNDEAFARELVVTGQTLDDDNTGEQDDFGPASDIALPSYSEAVSSPDNIPDNIDFPTPTISPLASPANENVVSPPPEPAPEPTPLPPPMASYTYPPTPSIAEPSISPRSPSLIATSPSFPEPPEPKITEKLHPDTALLHVRPTVKSVHSPISSPASSSVSLPLASPIEERSEMPQDTSSPAPGPAQYLDPDFLRGVSIGFMNPRISRDLFPMQGAFPNIVALPYGRAPPLHIQAPSWRHLLRLMARLSNTRIEANIEAMAATKATLRLRTVIQFVKAPDLSWRTLLWLTIDHPVPPGAQSWKWTNGDVNTLPWSYTLSNMPLLLRDGADSPNSKYYTVPSTTSTPFPTLPIKFPEFMSYLQAIWEDSRRAIHDSSSGMRRLAKMIDIIYPEENRNEGDDNNSERGGVGGLFKRVMGRGNKNKKGVNEETYDLVTPFVLDEY